MDANAKPFVPKKNIFSSSPSVPIASANIPSPYLPPMCNTHNSPLLNHIQDFEPPNITVRVLQRQNKEVIHVLSDPTPTNSGVNAMLLARFSTFDDLLRIRERIKSHPDSISKEMRDFVMCLTENYNRTLQSKLEEFLLVEKVFKSKPNIEECLYCDIIPKLTQKIVELEAERIVKTDDIYFSSIMLQMKWIDEEAKKLYSFNQYLKTYLQNMVINMNKVLNEAKQQVMTSYIFATLSVSMKIIYEDIIYYLCGQFGVDPGKTIRERLCSLKRAFTMNGNINISHLNPFWDIIIPINTGCQPVAHRNYTADEMCRVLLDTMFLFRAILVRTLEILYRKNE